MSDQLQPAQQQPELAAEETDGVLEHRQLPSEDFTAFWHSVLVENDIKERLLSQAILNFTLRPQVNLARLPLHGLILLVGPPGTGKTSLARGLASVTALQLEHLGPFNYVEVDPHALAGSKLGQSQQAVTHLLGTTVAEYARQRPTIVVLDEVETLAAARSRVNLEINPIDVHRATDALLAQLDHLAARLPQLLFIATSNFPEEIDAAFFSRSDFTATIDRPPADACRAIFRDTVEALAEHFPAVGRLIDTPEFEQASHICRDLDGRQIRKLVIAACTLRREAALDPNQLQPGDFLKALQRGKQEERKLKSEARKY